LSDDADGELRDEHAQGAEELEGGGGGRGGSAVWREGRAPSEREDFGETDFGGERRRREIISRAGQPGASPRGQAARRVSSSPWRPPCRSSFLRWHHSKVISLE
jgi:hypothetical protein